MIEYIEVRGADRELLGIIDTAQSVIWHTIWFGVGDFEVYAKSTDEHIELLKIGNYITRPDSDEIGIIEEIKIESDIGNGNMITATGRFAKSILDRRLIYNLSGTVNNATVLRGKVELAVRSVVSNNAITCSDTKRNFPMLELGALANIPDKIVDETGTAADKQVSYQNLLEYTDELLQEYNLSATVILDDSTKKLQYIVKQGADRSVESNREGEPVVFSREYDNLSASEYTFSTQNERNVALIGGEGEGIDRFYTLIAPNTITGLARREIFVDANSISKEYKDEHDEEKTYTDAQYTEMLKTEGKQKLAPLTVEEGFSGTIIVSEGNFVLNEDFHLGDIVTVQENAINKFVSVRITEVTEVQDENGYTIDAKYQ